MKRKSNQVDLVKMLFYILAHLWLVVLLAELGFAARYLQVTRRMPETYTASGTMYVNNGNPNINDYQYTSSYDLNAAVQLIKTYLVVVRSDKVMSAVTEKLAEDHPGITSSAVSSSVTMESVSETGVVAVKSTTTDPKLSTDIVNVVMEIAPDEIIRVVGAGNVEILDYATVPVLPNARNAVYLAVRNGASIGAAIAVAILAVLYLLNQKITSAQDLKDNYDLPILASIKRIDVANPKADSFMLTNQSPMEIVENYAKLRMNLFYTLVGKDKTAVVITSSISGEGKSTIASNLAISCAMSGKRVLLVDGDLRRASQMDIFKTAEQSQGLSDALVGQCRWQDVVLPRVRENVDLLPAGHIPPNPAELLNSIEMDQMIHEFEQDYDLVLLDKPPINIVSDPLVISSSVAGCLFVTRQNFTDRRDVRKALNAAEMTGMNILGFVFYGEHLHEGSYYSRRYYKSYYNKYDYRRHPSKTSEKSAEDDKKEEKTVAVVETDSVADQNVIKETSANSAQPEPAPVLNQTEAQETLNHSQPVQTPETPSIKEELEMKGVIPVAGNAKPASLLHQATAHGMTNDEASEKSSEPVAAVSSSGAQDASASQSQKHVIRSSQDAAGTGNLSSDQQKHTPASSASSGSHKPVETHNTSKQEKSPTSSSRHRKDAAESTRTAINNMRHSLQAFVRPRTKRTDDKKHGTGK